MLQATLLLFVAGVFVVAVFGKLRHHSAMAEIGEVAILLGFPRWLSDRAGQLLLAAEFCSAALLLVPPLFVAGAILAGALSLGLAVAIHRVRRNGAGSPSCRCFGAAESELRGRHIVRNVVLAGAAALALALRLADGPPRLTPAQWLPAVALAVIATLAVVHLDAILFLFAPAPTTRALAPTDVARDVGSAEAPRVPGVNGEGGDVRLAGAARVPGVVGVGRDVGLAGAARVPGVVGVGRDVGMAQATRESGAADVGRDIGSARATRGLGSAGRADAAAVPKLATTPQLAPKGSDQ